MEKIIFKNDSICIARDENGSYVIQKKCIFTGDMTSMFITKTDMQSIINSMKNEVI